MGTSIQDQMQGYNLRSHDTYPENNVKDDPVAASNRVTIDIPREREAIMPPNADKVCGLVVLDESGCVGLELGNKSEFRGMQEAGNDNAKGMCKTTRDGYSVQASRLGRGAIFANSPSGVIFAQGEDVSVSIHEQKEDKELKDAIAKAEKRKQKLDAVREENERLKNELAAKSATVRGLQMSVAEKERARNELQILHSQLKTKIDALQLKHDQTKTQNEKLTNDLKALKDWWLVRWFR